MHYKVSSFIYEIKMLTSLPLMVAFSNTSARCEGIERFLTRNSLNSVWFLMMLSKGKSENQRYTLKS